MQADHVDELRSICRAIMAQEKSEEEWRVTESDDEFQTEHFVGGFDGAEGAFCFSYYSPGGAEQWFQVTLMEVSEIAKGVAPVLALRSAD
jgi:hypothetical protein